ncbi:hypothetical protein ATE92_0071 [Ulvibacter sp. MAR_2010_11]|uniref:FKBP-type peptidyl-prolyl cis-trans isomerase n=1 Tax=Ulvibacter sp. MAR_2010_11 TaxID=1250229 RepID=UPI000C2B5EDA|nr:hypothetical protein [Ulvibacter sp. MAR_2010_11]PKA81950.1 hypothetical protein ATE92_0071 [Ulvibacter sp. MAR_2010_11]
MKKAYFLVSTLILTFLAVVSCKKDDGVESIPPRDRGEEAIAATTQIEGFLATHFYNYEEFENPPADFDYIIRFDSLIGANANKIPLIDQVQSKIVKDRINDDVTYTLYYLEAKQGGGRRIQFPDVGTMSFEGRLLDNSLFDGSINPVRFDLTQIIDGLQDGLIEFNTAAGDAIENPDGTVYFEDFSSGAVFIPSGLAYFSNPPPGDIGVYAQLAFTFRLYKAEIGDQDGDGVPSIMEDLNGNGREEDDDTDDDFSPNYADVDDDNDGRLTKDEIELNTYTINSGDAEPVLGPNEVEISREEDETTGVITINTINFPDEDNDGIPDYLDEDN